MDPGGGERRAPKIGGVVVHPKTTPGEKKPGKVLLSATASTDEADEIGN